MAGRHGGRERASGEQASEGGRVPRAVEIPQAPPAPSPESTAPPAPSGADTALPGHGLVAEGGSGSEAQGSGTTPGLLIPPFEPPSSRTCSLLPSRLCLPGDTSSELPLGSTQPPTPGDGIGEDDVGWLSALLLVMERTRFSSADTC